MVEDVRRIVAGRVPVSFYGRTGGVMPMPEEIADAIRETASAGGKADAGGPADAPAQEVPA